MDIEQWQNKTPRRNQKSQAAARAEADFASGMHAAMSYAQPPPWARMPTTSGQSSYGKWDHRKPEWECQCCGHRNFMTRPQCRQCRSERSKTAAFHPAGSPPPGRAAQMQATSPPQAGNMGAMQPYGKQPAADKSNDPIKLAEAAITAAQQAGAEEEVLVSLRATLEAKRQAATAKIPLAKRLQQATHRQSVAQATHTKAHEWLAVAQKAESEAQAAMAKARKEVEDITAEVAATSTPAESPAVCARTAALEELLAALRKADTEGNAAMPEVAAAVKAAQTALLPPPVPPEPAPDPAMEVQRIAEKRALELTRILEAETTEAGNKLRIAECLNQHWAGHPVPDFPGTQGGS